MLDNKGNIKSGQGGMLCFPSLTNTAVPQVIKEADGVGLGEVIMRAEDAKIMGQEPTQEDYS